MQNQRLILQDHFISNEEYKSLMKIFLTFQYIRIVYKNILLNNKASNFYKTYNSTYIKQYIGHSKNPLINAEGIFTPFCQTIIHII